MNDQIANPAPVGLMGFSLTTILLNVHNAGMTELDSAIMGMGLFVGGLAQLLAGMFEFKKNNLFGATAFTLYGAFWLSLVAIWILPAPELAAAANAKTMGVYLGLWGLFTLYMFFASLTHPVSTRVIFGSLTLLFFLLTAADFSGSHTLKMIAGWEGIFCGLSAFYAAMATVLNDAYGRQILPV